MRLVLPWPDKLLWPNGSRGNHYAVARVKKSAKKLAWAEAYNQRDRVQVGNGLVPVKLTVRAMPRGPLPDRDNCVAAAKAYLDGISAAIGVNDKHFAAPTVEFDTQRTGQMIVEIGE